MANPIVLSFTYDGPNNQRKSFVLTKRDINYFSPKSEKVANNSPQSIHISAELATFFYRWLDMEHSKRFTPESIHYYLEMIDELPETDQNQLKEIALHWQFNELLIAFFNKIIKKYDNNRSIFMFNATEHKNIATTIMQEQTAIDEETR
jgi:hypothetical protein